MLLAQGGEAARRDVVGDALRQRRSGGTTASPAASSLVKALLTGRSVAATPASGRALGRKGAVCDARGVPIAASLLVCLVALLHVYFLVLEMFLWATPFGQRTFGRSREEQEQTKSLAQNQGLYNGFLAAGLAWSFFAPGAMVFPLRAFFLGCVLVAGVVGAVTASPKILFVQALPAAVALALVIAAR